MRRINYSILCLVFVVFLVSGCRQNHIEGEPDVISSRKMNHDETLTVVANRDTIEDKEKFAELLINLLNFLQIMVMLQVLNFKYIYGVIR
jgi:hypothetical protein